MTPDRAAETLGVAWNASPEQVERAFSAKARRTHPDVAGGSADAFRDAVDARDTLLTARLDRVPQAPSYVQRARVQGPGLIAVWGGLLLIAAFLSIYGAPHPFTVIEPLIRWAVLIAATLAFAATGRRVFLIIATIAIGVTVILTVLFTSFGGLLGLMATIPAVFGAFTGGVAHWQRRRA